MAHDRWKTATYHPKPNHPTANLNLFDFLFGLLPGPVLRFVSRARGPPAILSLSALLLRFQPRRHHDLRRFAT